MRIIGDLTAYLEMCDEQQKRKRGVRLMSRALNEITRLYHIADAAFELSVAKTDDEKKRATERLIVLTENFFARLNGENKKS